MEQGLLKKKLPGDDIVQKNDPVLRQIAKSVSPEDIQSVRIRKVLARMNAALDSQEDGVAIAAPQIGEALRIFIVSRKAYALNEGASSDGRLLPEKNVVFINPRITRLSRAKKDMEEGCLSVRYYYGIVKRAQKATVEALDEEGKRFTYGGSGLMAEIFQHETDHLDGILFTDKARALRQLPPPTEHV
jgi:peptide deformylase